VLQCVAVCCSVMQCDAAWCSVVQFCRNRGQVHDIHTHCVAMCCGVLQCVAVCCCVILCDTVCCCVRQRKREREKREKKKESARAREGEREREELRDWSTITTMTPAMYTVHLRRITVDRRSSIIDEIILWPMTPVQN